MSKDFGNALDYVLQNEGTAFTNNPLDKGGPTKYGITIETLSRYLGKQATIDDVKNLDFPTVSDIYEKFYWNALYCDQLPYPIAAALFDTAVNRGKAIAVGIAQSCLINIHADGIMGEETIHALSVTDPEIFLYNYVKALLGSYIEVCLHAPSQLVFLKGWANRACRLFLLGGK